MTAAFVTGTINLAPDCTTATPTTADGVTHQRGSRYAPQTWTTDDVRLSGTAVQEWNQDTCRTGTIRQVVIGSERYELQNDVGNWVCHSNVVLAPFMGDLFSPSGIETSVRVGAGGYEGLSAILALDWTSDPVSITGAICPGEPPPAP